MSIQLQLVHSTDAVDHNNPLWHEFCRACGDAHEGGEPWCQTCDWAA